MRLAAKMMLAFLAVIAPLWFAYFGLLRPAGLAVLWTQELVPSFALLLVSALLVLGLSYALVARPIRRLGEQTRRVAAGDFRAPNVITQKDEIGMFANELNKMILKLDEAQRLVKRERQKRTTVLEQLRHADRLSTLGRLASSMAHELGTPLNVAYGRASMIVSDDDASTAASDNAKIIVEQCDRMTLIIQELLNFARRRPTARESVRIGDLLEHTRMLMEPMSEERGVAIGVEGDLDAGLMVDEWKMLQVLTNLTMNAIQASQSGGEIRLAARRERVEEPTDRRCIAGAYVCIDVSDRGVGIDPNIVEHIFQPFFTTKGSKEGTGLGLSVSEGIVREQGGWIEVQSQLGQGSTFRVYLAEGGSP